MLLGLQLIQGNSQCQQSRLRDVGASPSVRISASGSSEITRAIVIVAILCSALQILWFAPKCFHQINFDGMAYTGIARHLRNGEFHSAINAFRSPLISWIIAAAPYPDLDLLRVGKIVTIASYLLCLPLLYVFAVRLWGSRLVASLALLLFTLGRSLVVIAVSAVTPDFLFAALVLWYFIVLIKCLRTGRLQYWFLLGAVHGLAFLTKAFALPWLGLCTLVALTLSSQPRKATAARLALAAVVPLAVAAGWAVVLHSKYGVYTTGSQFKTNLLQSALHASPPHQESPYTLLRDTSQNLDEHMVDDPMAPKSWQWTYHISARQAFPKIARTELRNIPLVLKELAIVVTPGGLIAFLFMPWILGRREDHRVEWQVTFVVFVAAVSLTVAYSMLVFDGRYLFPLIPLVLAVGARSLVPEGRFRPLPWRKTCYSLVLLGVCASFFYRSSPFRLLTRDFQTPSYRAAELLKRQGISERLVSIGAGPFPEHGVGWEAGYQAAYFSNSRLVAETESLPHPSQVNSVEADLAKALPDAILIWGTHDDSRYAALVASLAAQYPAARLHSITDPALGEVGVLLSPLADRKP
jgi:hypothetical protein